MAREVRKLSARAVATIDKPGRHSDGNGLYLIVDPTGARRWLFLFRWEGKLKEMGLGGVGVGVVSLADARTAADAARILVRNGRNPIEQRRQARAVQAGAVTFGTFADDLVPELAKSFRNAKHAAQWTSTLNTYAASLRPLPIEAIGTADVLAVLQPIWTTKSETASRVRGRIERVLDAAKAKGLRTGDNPAAWRGNLESLLGKRERLTRGHHAAMPFVKVPAFVADLHDRKAVAALALEFMILTAARVGEVIGATTAEIDREAKVWTAPASRMKAGKEHRVPLSDRALAILDEVAPFRTGDHLFPGQRRGRPLSNAAFDALLTRMKITDVTPHGFRSSFRDWAGEATAFPREVAEAALAHAVGDETERAYRRADALAKRRKLMDAWAAYVGKGRKREAGNVVELRRA